MGTLFDSAERVQIEALAERGSSAAIRRRAQLLLLYDQGLPTQEVAQQVDLSPSRTRFWRRRFTFEGMAIFNDSSLVAEPSQPIQPDEGNQDLQPSPEPLTELGESTTEETLEYLDEIQASATEELPERLEESPAESSEEFSEPIPESENEPVSLDELRQRYPANLRRAEHRRDLALQLFDATQAIHQLPDGHRSLLEVAALLQYLTENQDDRSSNKSGYLFILSNPLTELSDAENKIVESTLRSLHGKVSDLSPAPELDQVPPPAAREAQTLAALLRIAHGLDASQTQDTLIDTIEVDSRGLSIYLRGPQAKLDARQAKKAAKLWTRLFEQKVRFQVVIPLDQESDARLDSFITRSRPGVEPEDSLAEAGRKVMGYNFAQMVLHEEGTRLGEDIEELHDMRVATRRMRAAFEVFQDAFDTKAIKTHLKGLRATGRALGRVRDLDVFMEKAQQYLDTIPQEHRSGLEPLLTLWANERQFDRELMLEHLNSEDYANFKRKFLKFISTPHLVQHVAPVLIYTRLASVRAFGPILESATIEQLHSLRIEFKKLRYTIEFFREVLGEEAKDLIEAIKILQDHLGDLNDADVACSILRDFIDEWESRQMYRPISERENPEPIVAYLASKHAERYFLTTTFQDAWQRFDQPEMRTKFASAVSIL
jgi:CHAD domain-containing protein